MRNRANTCGDTPMREATDSLQGCEKCALFEACDTLSGDEKTGNDASGFTNTAWIRATPAGTNGSPSFPFGMLHSSNYLQIPGLSEAEYTPLAAPLQGFDTAQIVSELPQRLSK